MQVLITPTQNIKKKKDPQILSCFACKVALDYITLPVLGIVLPETKKKLQVWNRSYLLPQYASQLKCQVDQAHPLSFTRNCPLLLALRHTLGVFWSCLKLICAYINYIWRQPLSTRLLNKYLIIKINLFLRYIWVQIFEFTALHCRFSLISYYLKNSNSSHEGGW